MKKVLAFILVPALLLLLLSYECGLLDVVHPLQTPKAGQIRVACVGDSITYGCNVLGWRRNNYPAVLGRLLGSGYCVNNFGYSSRTAGQQGDLPYADETLYQKSLDFLPDVVLLMLGTNDSKSFNWNREDFIRSFSALLQSYRNLPSRPEIWVLLPPPIVPRLGGKAAYHLQPQVLQQEILPLLRAIAAANAAETIDLQPVFAPEEKLFPDGVHPNARGAHLLAQTVYQSVFEPHIAKEAAS